ATICGAILFFDLMVIQEPVYKASSKILIVQKQIAGQDIYTISKSAQYLTKILKEGIYSDVFFEDVLLSPYQLEKNDFSKEAKKRRKEWERDIRVAIVRDLGVMEIDVFHSEREKAKEINLAIINVLEKDHSFYHGGGENVELKILDYPLVSERPVTVKLWIGSFLGALIGFLIGIGWVLRKWLKGGEYNDGRLGEGFTSIGEEIEKRREQKYEEVERPDL
ncbi:MAG: hypothetical protein U9P63_03800, partial [Patescibacteria group bacterium]|nr:hypothetical protein [Patescibacteria group bacterium]